MKEKVSVVTGDMGGIGQTICQHLCAQGAHVITSYNRDGDHAAAKAGIHGFTKSLALEVARKSITVNTISPGYVGTDMVMAIPADIREKIITQIPVGRLGHPAEIAHVVSFLASSDSGFITGANIAVNGGQYLL